MGCGGSRSSRILPAVRLSSSADANDDDACHHTCSHCGRPYAESFDAERRSFSSPSSYASFSDSNPASIPRTGPWLSNSIHSSSLGDGDQTSRTSRSSRSYFLLSTSSFRSPASDSRNNLALDPTLFPDVISPSTDGARNTNIDTACGSHFSDTSLSLS
ncbi:unnamed protein product, partial [Ectocarpus sp. 12 AP-2014]